MQSLFPSPTHLRWIVDSLDSDGPPRMELPLKADHGLHQQPGRLGVVVASFNPPTAAHVMMAETALRTAHLDEVLFLLSKRNVDKPLFGASLEDRLAMVTHFAVHHPTFSTGIVTHARFVDQVEALRICYPPETEIVFIIGFDTLLRVFDPKYYTDPEEELRRLFAAATFIVANRGAHDVDEAQEFLYRPENRPYADQVRFIHLDPFHASLSSTEVRRRVAAGETIGDLVPVEVADYIEEQRLYRSSQT